MYDYQHTWTPVSDSGCPVLNAGFDFARDVLSDEDFKEVLNGSYHDLYNLALELQVPLENATVQENKTNIVDPSLTGTAKGVEEVIQRLKIIENEIRDLKHEIQGLRYYEHRLLTELHWMGNLIPDLSKAVASLTDNPLVYGAAGAGVVGAVAAARQCRGRSRDVQQDVKAAQQWIVDFLREKGCSSGKDIAETFGLWRVRYRDDGQVAWVCRRHMYTRANEIVEVPM
nr:protein TORNADO 1 [Tanacetum cinerariifolium]